MQKALRIAVGGDNSLLIPLSLNRLTLYPTEEDIVPPIRLRLGM
jgi:hypothetical protein